MKRVAVFGNAGGGKSTLARRLADLTALPLYPVDTMQWTANADPIPHHDYLKAHADVLSHDEYVLSGDLYDLKKGARLSKYRAHNSAVLEVDEQETVAALRELFGSTLPKVSGSKGALGHSLGASSALEVAVCVQGLLEQTVPTTAGHEIPEIEGVECTRSPLRGPLNWVLNNAFAFGGLNSSLLLRRWDS